MCCLQIFISIYLGSKARCWAVEGKNAEYTDNFLKEAKQLSKKFKLLKTDLKQAVEEIETKNDLGVYLGFNLFKKISSKILKGIPFSIFCILILLLVSALLMKSVNEHGI